MRRASKAELPDQVKGPSGVRKYKINTQGSQGTFLNENGGKTVAEVVGKPTGGSSAGKVLWEG